MTACGFCVVAALSSQTSGRPWTRSRRIGKVALHDVRVEHSAKSRGDRGRARVGTRTSSSTRRAGAAGGAPVVAAGAEAPMPSARRGASAEASGHAGKRERRRRVRGAPTRVDREPGELEKVRRRRVGRRAGERDGRRQFRSSRRGASGLRGDRSPWEAARPRAAADASAPEPAGAATAGDAPPAPTLSALGPT